MMFFLCSDLQRTISLFQSFFSVVVVYTIFCLKPVFLFKFSCNCCNSGWVWFLEKPVEAENRVNQYMGILNHPVNQGDGLCALRAQRGFYFQGYDPCEVKNIFISMWWDWSEGYWLLIICENPSIILCCENHLWQTVWFWMNSLSVSCFLPCFIFTLPFVDSFFFPFFLPSFLHFLLHSFIFPSFRCSFFNFIKNLLSFLSSLLPFPFPFVVSFLSFLPSSSFLCTFFYPSLHVSILPFYLHSLIFLPFSLAFVFLVHYCHIFSGMWSQMFKEHLLICDSCLSLSEWHWGFQAYFLCSHLADRCLVWPLIFFSAGFPPHPPNVGPWFSGMTSLWVRCRSSLNHRGQCAFFSLKW